FFFFQAEDGIRGFHVTGVQTCALPIFGARDEIARRVPAGTNSHRLSLSVPRIGGQSTNRERLCHRAAPAAGDQGSGVEKAGTRLRLQAAGHGGPALAQARRRPAPPPGASGGEVQRRHHAGAARSRRAEGGRLITLDPQHLTIALARRTAAERAEWLQKEAALLSQENLFGERMKRLDFPELK